MKNLKIITAVTLSIVISSSAFAINPENFQSSRSINACASIISQLNSCNIDKAALADALTFETEVHSVTQALLDTVVTEKNKLEELLELNKITIQSLQNSSLTSESQLAVLNQELTELKGQLIELKLNAKQAFKFAKNVKNQSFGSKLYTAALKTKQAIKKIQKELDQLT